MTVASPPDHVVVVLNWHGRADTLDCVASLRTGSPEATVLVVDNGSYDGSLAEVSARWPEVSTLQLTDNLGYAGGMNAGISWALARGAATMTVLNNDTVVPSGVMARLASVAADGCAVSPVVRYRDDPTRIWFGGATIEDGIPVHAAGHQLAPADGTGLRQTPALSGCCLTASAATWRRVGMFDERYFLIFEDSDWSARAARAGVRLVVDTTVAIDHTVSASLAQHAAYPGLFYYCRNGLRYLATQQGTAIPRQLAFLRRHVLPQARGRRAVVTVAAVASYAAGRSGRAPRWVERAD